jgi:hypothetical protein
MKFYKKIPVPICVALIGLLSALLSAVFTNLDRIANLIEIVNTSRATSSSQITGEWTGVFRECFNTCNHEGISSELVVFKQRDNFIKGSTSCSDKLIRSWNLTGYYQNGFLVTYYTFNRSAGSGMVAYILEGTPEMGLLLGFWTGYDPENRKLMSCPYVLSRNKDVDQVKRNYSQWLNRRCFKQD